MTQINRVDQAILLLKDRLRKLAERQPKTSPSGATAGFDRAARLAPLRQLAHAGAIADQDLRRAFVRTLLADSLGEGLASSLDFQALADRVTQMLEADPASRELLGRALTELE